MPITERKDEMLSNDNVIKLLKTGRVIEWNKLISEKRIPLEVWQEGNAREPQLSGVNLRGMDLDEVDLPYINLSQSLLNKSSFYYANLKKCDLRYAQLEGADLVGCDLSGANLSNANLQKTNLSEANLSGANLTNANLYRAEIEDADLSGAILHRTYLNSASFYQSNLSGVDLSNSDALSTSFIEADLSNSLLKDVLFCDANLTGAKLNNAVLERANLECANLSYSNLSGAIFNKAILVCCTMVGANCYDTNFNGCTVYGISAWDLDLGKVKAQSDLIITPPNQSVITVDNLEVAQFVYLILNNAKIRDVIETISKKGVLILGRFSKERKYILNNIKDKLRELGYVPMMFDFEKPTQRDFTETIKTLAGMCRFIVADITNPQSSPLELQATMPDYMIPLVPIIQEGEEPFSMFIDLQNKYSWVLDVLYYDKIENLVDKMENAIINPALACAEKLTLKKGEKIRARHVNDY